MIERHEPGLRNKKFILRYIRPTPLMLYTINTTREKILRGCKQVSLLLSCYFVSLFTHFLASCIFISFSWNPGTCHVIHNHKANPFILYFHRVLLVLFFIVTFVQIREIKINKIYSQKNWTVNFLCKTKYVAYRWLTF